MQYKRDRRRLQMKRYFEESNLGINRSCRILTSQYAFWTIWLYYIRDLNPRCARTLRAAVRTPTHSHPLPTSEIGWGRVPQVRRVAVLAFAPGLTQQSLKKGFEAASRVPFAKTVSLDSWYWQSIRRIQQHRQHAWIKSLLEIFASVVMCNKRNRHTDYFIVTEENVEGID